MRSTVDPAGNRVERDWAMITSLGSGSAGFGFWGSGFGFWVRVLKGIGF